MTNTIAFSEIGYCTLAERYRVGAVVNIPLASEDLRWELSLFWRKQKHLSFAAQAMIALIKQHLSQLESET